MAKHSHKRETARRKPRAALIAGPLAALATGAVVTAGVAGSNPTSILASDPSAAAGAAGAAGGAFDDRGPVVSRGGGRDESTRATTAAKPEVSPVEKALAPAAVERAIKSADKQLWATAPLNLWTTPDENAAKLGVLKEGKKVLVTGRKMLGREEIVVDGRSRWVTVGYLSAEKPDPGPSVDGVCTNGSSVPSGVSPHIANVHQAVCAAWPEITTYGTFRADSGDHGSGRAVDIMISGSTGWEIAEFLRANYSDFGISYVIYSQKIWSVERSGEGWRPMEDRGSVTANHYDHVHVSVY